MIPSCEINQSPPNKENMSLGPYLDFDGVDYECRICERSFKHEAALYDHCRYTSRHSWCERCSRVFLNSAARDTHLRESNTHYICSTCPQTHDFENYEDLKDHLVDSHHYCTECATYCNSKDLLRQHDVEKHHLCIKCGDYFANKNNLQLHQQKHQPRNIECYGCYDLFKTFSGMLIHLESGTCSSEVTEEEIDDIARQCFQSKRYIDDTPENEGWTYMCPGCDKAFFKLSALYQHVEDVAPCSPISKENGCLAKLERFIARSLG